MKNFFMRYWWVWAVVIFSVLPMMFFWCNSNHQDERHVVEPDSGLVDPYPAFDEGDSLWETLDSIEKEWERAWSRGERKPRISEKGFMHSVLESDRSGNFNDEWTALEAITVTDSKELDSLVERVRDLGASLFFGDQDRVPGLEPGFETELTFEVKYDATQKKQTARILKSTTPNEVFEKFMVEWLENCQMAFPQSFFEKSFRIVSKYYIFKEKSWRYNCRGGSADSLCNVSLVRGGLDFSSEKDSLNFRCSSISYGVYRGKVITFTCSSRKKSSVEGEKKIEFQNVNLLYEAPLKGLFEFWETSGYTLYTEGMVESDSLITKYEFMRTNQAANPRL